MRRPLGVALLALALAAPRLPAQTITAGPGGELSSLVGMPFDVPLVVDMSARAELLGSFAARLSWDPAVLRLDGVSSGSFGSLTVNADSIALGILRLAGANPAGVGGQVTVALLRFTPVLAGTTALTTEFSELFAAGSFADLMPSLVVNSGVYCTALGRFGDIDRDGNANSRDALIALSNAVGLDVSGFEITLGDVDANGATNARDALIILSAAVGLDVSAFRVGRLAGGACALNETVALSISPSGFGDLVAGQTISFEARASAPGGGLVTVTDVSWLSSNSDVLGILQSGVAVARAPGSVVVTAVRAGTDTATTSVNVVARRTVHYVSADAAQNANRIGTAVLPYASIDEAQDDASDGDTIVVRPGRYEAGAVVRKNVVVMGDTLADGTRPLVAGSTPDAGPPGLSVEAQGAVEIHRLAFENVPEAVDVFGPSALLVRRVTTQSVQTAVTINSPAASIRVEQSVLLGAGVETFYYSDGISVFAPVDTLTIEDTEIGEFGRDGVYAADPESVTVRRSSIHDVGAVALEVAPYIGGDAPPAFGAASISGAARQLLGAAIVVEQSSLRRADYDLVSLDTDIRRYVSSGSTYQNDDDIFYIYADQAGYVSLKGDSILCVIDQYCYWMDANYLDSLVVDSLTALNVYYGDAYNVPVVRITNSSFLEVTYEVLEVYFGFSVYGDEVTIDNVTVTGDSRYEAPIYAFYVEDARTTVDSLNVTNAYYAIEVDGDSSLTVTNSTFRFIDYPVQYYGYTGWRGGLTVTNSTFQSYDWAIEGYDGPIVVDSNTFSNGYGAAIDVGARAAVIVTRNRITDAEYGILAYLYDSSVVAVISDNVMTGIKDYGISVDGDLFPDTIRPRFEMARDTVVCNPDYLYDTGIEVYAADLLLTDSRVTGCPRGVFANNDGSVTSRSDSIIRTTVELPPNAFFGINVIGNYRTRISSSTVTGDTVGPSQAGGIWVDRAYYCTYVYACDLAALVDSNSVTGMRYAGIRFTGGDTVVAFGNTVNGVAPYSFYGAQGGIVFEGQIDGLGLASGNIVQNTLGSGVYAYTTTVATVRVDSNRIANSWAGIYAVGAYDTDISRNRVTGSDSAGVWVAGTGEILSISQNNFSGNRFGVKDNGFFVTALNNWWGDPLGPRCAAGCDPGSTGDSVGANTSFNPWLTTEEPGTPPPAPPAVLAASAYSRVAAPVAVQAGERPGGRDGRLTERAVPAGGRRAGVRSTDLSAARRPAAPPVESPDDARRARRAELRNAAAAAGAQRREALAQARAAELSERAARFASREERRREREAQRAERAERRREGGRQ